MPSSALQTPWQRFVNAGEFNGRGEISPSMLLGLFARTASGGRDLQVALLRSTGASWSEAFQPGSVPSGPV